MTGANRFRRAYPVVAASGRRVEPLALRVLETLDPLLTGDRLLVALDDTPTPRNGPCVEGAGPDPGGSGGPRRH